MKPVCSVTVDGGSVSADFNRRLSECEVVDNEGVSSDTVRLTLDDWPPAAIPATGAIIEVSLGYEGRPLTFMGRFTAEEIEVACFPHTISVTGKSASMGGPTKVNRNRHWDGKTLGEIVALVSADMGYPAWVDPQIGAHAYEWLGQIGEGNIHFLERLAERHGAIFNVKNGQVIFAQRGGGITPGGVGLSLVTVTPDTLQPGSCRVTMSDRPRYKEVRTHYMDRATGMKKTVTEPCKAGGNVLFEHGFPCADEAEARRVASSRAGELDRRCKTFSASVLGDPTIKSGMPLVFEGVRSGVDGEQFVIDTATHRFSKSGGYITDISGQVK